MSDNKVNTGWPQARMIGVVSLALLLTACASLQWQPERPRWTYLPEDDGSLLARGMPAIVVEHPERGYNRIGRARAAFDATGAVTVTVDPEAPVVYAGVQGFETARGRYTNLVYRIHFQRVPYRLLPFHLTAGRHGGLLVVVTLDGDRRPLLITTVHTCGCYLAMVPTRFLPAEAYPEGWDPTGQTVYGAALPGVLELPGDGRLGAWRPVIYLRDATHRVIHIEVARGDRLTDTPTRQSPTLMDLDALERLPLPGGQTTSFYYDSGARRGYVKGAHKPFELLFMSWWTWDLRVGVDKRYNDDLDSGTVFYTSLKPWRRRASDMRDFPGFLAYWGWRL